MECNAENIIPIVVLDTCIIVQSHYNPGIIKNIIEHFLKYKGFMIVPQIIIEELKESYSSSIQEHRKILHKMPQFIVQTEFFKEFEKNSIEHYLNRFNELITFLESQKVIPYKGEITEEAANRTIRKKAPAYKKSEFKDCLIFESLIYASKEFKSEHNKIYFITQNHNDFDLKNSEFNNECNLHNIILLKSTKEFLELRENFIKNPLQNIKSINYYDVFQNIYNDLSEGESLLVSDVKEHITDCIINKIGEFSNFVVENISCEDFNVEEFGFLQNTKQMECCLSEKYSFYGYTEENFYHPSEYHNCSVYYSGKIVIFGQCTVDENEKISDFYDINYGEFKTRRESDDDYDNYWDR